MWFWVYTLHITISTCSFNNSRQKVSFSFGWISGKTSLTLCGSVGRFIELGKKENRTKITAEDCLGI